MVKPKVSCVVATKNRGHLIKGMLMSLKHQILKDWECIIIEDMCEDWTTFVIGTIADGRIKNYANDGKGKSRAMNMAKEYINGDYVCVFDDDDIMMPCKLDVSYKMMEETGADFGYSARFTHLLNNQITYTPTKPFDMELFLERPFIGFGSVVTTKDLFMEIDFDEDMPASLDFDWIGRCALAGAKMAYTDIPLYVWRNHLGSITFNSNILQRTFYDKSKGVIERKWKRMKKPKNEVVKWPNGCKQAGSGKA